ncbi:MAG TPA: hypothetical protein VJ260_03855 [Vicinamibacterales bacterium]|jgi:hypothetical protein|nr:hypothetical protein [Vicinamibacterales bacterium]
MSNRDDVLRDRILREKTFKGETHDVMHRVFYTLHQDKELQVRRNAKAIALLVQRLHATGAFPDRDLDDFLLEVVK